MHIRRTEVFLARISSDYFLNICLFRRPDRHSTLESTTLILTWTLKMLPKLLAVSKHILAQWGKEFRD